MESTDQDEISLLFSWMKQNGGVFNIKVGYDPENQARGLYASKDINYPTFTDEPIVKIPNKLLVTSHHLSPQSFSLNGSITYSDIYSLSPELFDSKYPYKANSLVPSRKDNEYGEYFKITIFLIAEKKKGKKSDWFPFINYLPKEIQTLYTYPDETYIHKNSKKTLQSEIELKDDYIFETIKLDREIHNEQRDRFLKFCKDNQQKLQEAFDKDGKEKFEVTEEDFEWAWMNLGTRCFGTHHLPGEIAMVPLLDLLNHSSDEKMKYFVEPYDLHRKMILRGIDVLTNKELELDYQQELDEFDNQDKALELESQDLDQHQDDYPNRYYNYLPVPKKIRFKDEDEEETDKDKYIEIDEVGKIWKLNEDNVFFGVKPYNNTVVYKEGEEVNLCYGERANSFLLVEYGFTIRDNRFDFVRIKDVTQEQVKDIGRKIGLEETLYNKEEVFRDKLKELHMKDKIQVDFKMSNLNRDLLRLIRSTLIKQPSDIMALKIYRQICQDRLSRYSTSIGDDIELLQKVQKDKDEYHWMYQFVLIYKIGQKQILGRNIYYCDKLIEAYTESDLKWDKFFSLTQELRGYNGMSDYLNEARYTYFP